MDSFEPAKRTDHESGNRVGDYKAAEYAVQQNVRAGDDAGKDAKRLV
jgi:hypothetical protein